MNLAKVWDICTKLLWDSKYITGLDELFKSNNITTILDCAGGTGFPSIELKKMGWNITYSDGNKQMLDLFKKKSHELQISAYFSNWQDLKYKVPGKFDAILCRGNSLIYINSWETNHITSRTKDHIKHALKEMFNQVNDGGFLYIDIPSSSEYNQSSYPLIERLPERTIDKQKVQITWEIGHNTKKKLRTVIIKAKIGKNLYAFTEFSYLLTQEDAINLLKEVGFKKVIPTNIPGEEVYNVILGFK